MRITALRSDKRAPGCLGVELDGVRFATLSVETVKALGFARGMELDGTQLERLRYVADVEGAYQVAVRMLAARPRGVNELLWRLRERGLNPSAVAEAVGRLETEGILDDAEFARHFARVRSARGHGPSRLLTDLLARGVDRRVAERAIAAVLDAEGVDPREQLRALATKRSEQLGTLPPRTKRRRLLGYLRRRGYTGYEAAEAVDEVLRAPHAAPAGSRDGAGDF